MLKKQQLYMRLVQDIKQGIWQAGKPVTQQQLASYYDVSRIPVRDVLQQLFAEHWLAPHGKAGLMVPPLTAEEAEELYQIRLQLEPMALELAFPHLTYSLLGQAEDLLQTLEQQQKLSPFSRGELNWQFHLLLYQSCNKPHLLRLLGSLHQQVSRYLGFQEDVMRYSSTSDTEHRKLLVLLRQKDITQAQQLLHQHIETAGRLLVQYLKKQKPP